MIGFAAGRIPQAPANYLLLKNAAAVGVFWGAYMKNDPSVILRGFEELLGWYADGLLVPHISATFDLEETSAAMAMLLARKSTGKIVIETGLS